MTDVNVLQLSGVVERLCMRGRSGAKTFPSLITQAFDEKKMRMI
jgi:hypothetical protein